MIAAIATIAEKRVQRSKRSYGNTTTAILAITTIAIALDRKNSISAIVAIK